MNIWREFILSNLITTLQNTHTNNTTTTTTTTTNNKIIIIIIIITPKPKSTNYICLPYLLAWPITVPTAEACREDNLVTVVIHENDIVPRLSEANMIPLAEKVFMYKETAMHVCIYVYMYICIWCILLFLSSQFVS